MRPKSWWNLPVPLKFTLQTLKILWHFLWPSQSVCMNFIIHSWPIIHTMMCKFNCIILVSFCPSQGQQAIFSWGSFNNYEDQILPNFDPFPHSSGQLWTFYMILPFSRDQAWTVNWPPSTLFLVHVVIEWALTHIFTSHFCTDNKSDTAACVLWNHFRRIFISIPELG